MKSRSIALSLLFVCLVAARASAQSVENVQIVANDQMKFSVTRIEAQPGQTVHVELKNSGTLPLAVMGHNWILLKAGKDPVAYANQAMVDAVDHYMPKNLADEVITFIGLTGPGKTGDVTFKAPGKPGEYAYLCSFPGHCQSGMRGVLVVK